MDQSLIKKDRAVIVTRSNLEKDNNNEKLYKIHGVSNNGKPNPNNQP